MRVVPLGRSDIQVSTSEYQLEPGERFLMLTDGIPKIGIDSSRLFGLSRYARLCEETLEMPLAEAGWRTLEPAREANGSRTQADDWAFVLTEWTARKTLEPAATAQGA